jgi:hypothetical protein
LQVALLAVLPHRLASVVGERGEQQLLLLRPHLFIPQKRTQKALTVWNMKQENIGQAEEAYT